MFDKLLDLSIPGGIIKNLFDCYSKTFTMVRWNNSFSRLLLVHSGIRQGGILSPLLFNIYINTIITALERADIGCHGSLSAVTHAPFHASMLRPASQAGPMHEFAWVGKLVNAALLSLINEACVNVCCATLLSSELIDPACVQV